jgi:hypothetical protein
MKRTAVLSITLLLSSIAYAHAKPTPEQIKDVIDYFYSSHSDAVTLTQVKLCDDVYTEGDHKYECMSERTGNSLKSGDEAYVWMMFMVPDKADPQTIMVQVSHDGVPMSVERTTVKSALRYRTWKKIKPDRAGKWKVKIFHDKGDDVALMKELTFTVSGKKTQ